jgi:electron transfer flavoprotein alpha subunit
MGNVLAFCETSGSSLRTNALANLSFARKAAEHHGGDVIAVLIGKGAGDAADHACTFAKKVIVVDDDALEHYQAETYAPIVARLAGEHGASVVSATAGAVGKDLLPRVAVLLGAGMASDISDVLAANQFKRPIQAGNAYATIEVSTDTICVTVRQSEFDPAAALDGSGERLDADAGDLNTFGAEVLRVETQASDRPDLNDADVVIAGGRGMGGSAGFEELEKLADVLGAAMGASRAATDAGMVPADWQVGQTGKIVAPNLYIAVGISGAIQHLAGMKNSKTIVAINKNGEEPIFQVADYGLVAKWEDTLEELVSAIAEVKKANA